MFGQFENNSDYSIELLASLQCSSKQMSIGNAEPVEPSKLCLLLFKQLDEVNLNF